MRQVAFPPYLVTLCFRRVAGAGEHPSARLNGFV